MANARTVKKKTRKKRGYKTWSSDDVKALRRHSKERTPITKVARELKRSEPTIRMKAYSLSLSMGHRRRGAKKKARL
jgi:hypothetical protein